MRHFNVTYDCDGCQGLFDPETSVAYIAFADEMRRKISNLNPIARFSIHPWREDLAASGDAKHFCSGHCARIGFAAWLVDHPEARCPAKVSVNADRIDEAEQRHD